MNMEEKERQKEIFELNMLDMQLRQMEQQAMMVEQQILEQQTTSHNLDELKKTKNGQNMLFPFSKDIFIEGKLEKNDVLVNIGSKTLVRKSIEDAKKIVVKQRDRLLDVSDEIKAKMSEIIARISELEKELNP